MRMTQDILSKLFPSSWVSYTFVVGISQYSSHWVLHCRFLYIFFLLHSLNFVERDTSVSSFPMGLILKGWSRTLNLDESPFRSLMGYSIDVDLHGIP